MKKDITLLILAAGMGSRFGGLKQIEEMGPNKEFIIDYSIYDAKKAGFNKVVFLIKEENYDKFVETIGKRVEPHIKVEYCFQKNDNVPSNINIPSTRIKPLGTAHAILCCKDKIKENFAIINADDFYGFDAFLKAYQFLSKENNKIPNYGLIGYEASKTITENGSVKRGICIFDEDNNIEDIVESVIKYDNNHNLVASPLNKEDFKPISKDTTVSMNLLLFTKDIFKYLESDFSNFLEYNINDLDTCEYLIPEVLSDVVNKKLATGKVIKTSALWYGVTYKEDTPIVKEALANLIEQKIYKSKLWEE